MKKWNDGQEIPIEEVADITYGRAYSIINRVDRNRTVTVISDIETAVVESGKVRFRPVLLTSITTVAGLLPILLERSFQAQFIIPMAIGICFGLLAATVLTLLYVPALYLIVRDIQNSILARFQHAIVGPPLAGDRGQTVKRY